MAVSFFDAGYRLNFWRDVVIVKSDLIFSNGEQRFAMKRALIYGMVIHARAIFARNITDVYRILVKRST